MERRGLIQPLEVDEASSRVGESPKQHARPNTAQWVESGMWSGFSDAVLQCFGTASHEAFTALERKSASLESRMRQVSDSLRQERELRATDLSAFDARVEQLREEKETSERELDDLRITHQGALQQFEVAQRRNESLAEDLQESQASVLRWSTQAGELENSLAEVCQDLQSARSSNQTEKDALEGQLEAQTRRASELQEEAADLTARITHTEHQLASSQQDLQHANEKLTEMRQQIEAATKLETRLRRELEAGEQRQANTMQQVQDLQIELQDLQSRHERLTQQFQEQGDQHASLSKKLQEKEAEALDLDAQFQEQTATLASVHGELDSKLNLISSLEGQNKEQALQLESLQSQCRILSQESEHSSTRWKEAEIKAKNSEEMIEELSEKLLRTQNQFTASEESRQELHARCAESDTLGTSQKRQMDEQQRYIGELERRLQSLEARQSTDGQDAEDLSAAYAEEHEAKVKAQSRVKSLECQLAEAKETSSAQEKDLQALGNELERYEEEIGRLMSQLERVEVAQEAETTRRENGYANENDWGGSKQLDDLHSSTKEPSSNLDANDAELNKAQIQTNDNRSISRGHSLNGVFKDREEWQSVCAEGLSQGWLINADQVIGKGSFGETYLGLFDGETVAVKCVRVSREIEAKIFLRELKALARVRHANLMAFRGAVLDPPQTCWLIVEYLSGGTLADWLYGKEGSMRGAPRRTLQEKLNMGTGIAKGMLALEATDPPIMHRDLKPTNVLLDASSSPRISDFGLCREHLEAEAYSYTGETGSYTYMSPEMMRGEMYGPSTDVYSYAILLAEILRQRPPFEEFYLSPVQIAEGVAYNDIRPSLPREVPPGLKYLIEACWCPEPEGRPDFSTITGHLMDISKSLPTKRGFFS